MDTPYSDSSQGATTLVVTSTIGSAVEFSHGVLGHYFLTADIAEINSLISNPSLGWSPTGLQFPVFARSDFVNGAQSVCRFYGSIDPGPNSHFYTVGAQECSNLKSLQAITPATQPRWNFEGTAFNAVYPDHGSCPTVAPTKVYRLYNNQAAAGSANHRYTTMTDVYDQMRQAGWIGEGEVMCVPE